MGKGLNIPVVSGGDRHGREPNAILNLSRAATFPNSCTEIRRERLSHVVFMPQYHDPLKMRVLQTMVDVVRDYPENFADAALGPIACFTAILRQRLPFPSPASGTTAVPASSNSS